MSPNCLFKHKPRKLKHVGFCYGESSSRWSRGIFNALNDGFGLLWFWQKPAACTSAQVLLKAVSLDTSGFLFLPARGQGMFVLARTSARLQLKGTLEWYTWVIAHAFNSIFCSLWYSQVAIRNVPFQWKEDRSEGIVHSEGSSGLLNVKIACIFARLMVGGKKEMTKMAWGGTYNITIMKIMFARPAEHHWAHIFAPKSCSHC